jgi:hypothetical protein
VGDNASRFILLFGPLLMLGGLVLGLRWTFGTGPSLPAPRIPDPADPTGDGLLEEVSRVPTEAAAQVLRARLGAAGIRATIGGSDAGGYRLLVFADDLANARVVLSKGALE